MALKGVCSCPAYCEMRMSNSLKMKRNVILLGFLVALSLPLSVDAQRVCAVSSDPSNNWGACRVSIYGDGDMCYNHGSGPAFSGTLIANEEEEEG